MSGGRADSTGGLGATSRHKAVAAAAASRAAAAAAGVSKALGLKATPRTRGPGHYLMVLLAPVGALAVFAGLALALTQRVRFCFALCVCSPSLGVSGSRPSARWRCSPASRWRSRCGCALCFGFGAFLPPAALAGARRRAGGIRRPRAGAHAVGAPDRKPCILSAGDCLLECVHLAGPAWCLCAVLLVPVLVGCGLASYAALPLSSRICIEVAAAEIALQQNHA